MESLTVLTWVRPQLALDSAREGRRLSVPALGLQVVGSPAVRLSSVLRWTPLVLVTVLLFLYAAYSKQPADPFQWRPFHLTADLSPTAFTAATTKAAHWIHFGVTCLLAHLALARRSPLPALAVTMAIGLLVELEQAFTSRGGKVADLLPDLLGALCATGLILAVRRLRRRTAAPDVLTRELTP